MKKKELYIINEELFKKNQKYIALYEEQKAENAKLLEEIEKLRIENAKLASKPEQSKPLENLEEKLKIQAKISEEAKFGAAAIGKIVIKATSSCNSLTAANDGFDPKELVNLILGRTEVAKAEILKIVEAEDGLENKINRIESVKKTAMDYIDSVMAQKD